MKPKTLHGVAVSQQAFKDAVAAAIEERGRARPRDILRILGPEWLAKEAGRVVAVTMGNMVRSKWLIKDAEGFYKLAPSYEVRHGRLLENSVVNTVIKLGGIAATSQILDAYGCRPNVRDTRARGGSAAQGSTYRMIMRILESTKKLVRHYHGPWGLPYNQLAAVPMPGHWLEFMTVNGFLECAPAKFHKRGHEQMPFDIVYERFKAIGNAVQSLRDLHELTLEELLQDDGISDAMYEMRSTSARAVSLAHAHVPHVGSRAVGQALDEIHVTARNAAAAQGRPDDEKLIETLRLAEKECLPSYLLASFERGVPLLHRASSAKLFRAYARRFNVSAALLSRGVIEGCPNSTPQ